MDMDFGGTAATANSGDGNGGSSGTACMELPLYLDAWVDELFERVTALVSNLDTGPGHRTDLAAPARFEASASFLLAVRGGALYMLGFWHCPGSLCAQAYWLHASKCCGRALTAPLVYCLESAGLTGFSMA